MNIFKCLLPHYKFKENVSDDYFGKFANREDEVKI